MDVRGLLLPAFRFGIHDPQEAEELVRAGVAGFCLYGGSSSEVRELTQRLRNVACRPLLFASDFENGAGSQLAGAVELPSNMALGVKHQAKMAYLKGWITGQQARALGINWIFAPVVDLSVRPDNPIVSIRSFGADPKLVSLMARAFIQGASKAGAAACLKHFPGHGDTRVDSHLELARIERPFSLLNRKDLLPYRALARQAQAMMSAHLILPEIDALPASLSRKWINEILRGRLGFRGVVVTDALIMGAIVKNFGEEETLRLALQAGNDLLLYPQDPWSAIKILDTLAAKSIISKSQIAASAGRLQQLWRPAGTFKPGSTSAHHLHSLSLTLARQSLAWLNAPGPRFVFPNHGKISYAEMGNKKTQFLPKKLRAAAPMHDKSRIENFSQMLNGGGFKTQEFPPEGLKFPALIAVFHKPRAFSGQTGLSPKEKKELDSRLRGNDEKGVVDILVICFGDPYVARAIPKGIPVLGAFSDCPASQSAVLEFLRRPRRLPVWRPTPNPRQKEKSGQG